MAAKESISTSMRAQLSSAASISGRSGEGHARTEGPERRHDKKFGAPTVTKDASPSRRRSSSRIHYENMGAQMVKEVATKNSDLAGDGTHHG